jgi:SAM-dependent methyltransferase
MGNKSTVVTAQNFSGSSSRYAFLVNHYKPGNVLDIGNIGGVFGEIDNSFSFHLKFVADAKESIVHGFDLFAPDKNADLYKNQKYGDLEEGLPYEDKYFDTVYLGELIEHLSNPGFAVTEIRRVLKDDGVFILDTPNAYDIKKIIKYLFQREENMGDVTHVILFTPGSLKALLEKNGFAIKRMEDKKSNLSSKFPFLTGMGSNLLVAADKKSSI